MEPLKPDQFIKESATQLEKLAKKPTPQGKLGFSKWVVTHIPNPKLAPGSKPSFDVAAEQLTIYIQENAPKFHDAVALLALRDRFREIDRVPFLLDESIKQAPAVQELEWRKIITSLKEDFPDVWFQGLCKPFSRAPEKVRSVAYALANSQMTKWYVKGSTVGRLDWPEEFCTVLLDKTGGPVKPEERKALEGLLEQDELLATTDPDEWQKMILSHIIGNRLGVEGRKLSGNLQQLIPVLERGQGGFNALAEQVKYDALKVSELKGSEGLAVQFLKTHIKQLGDVKPLVAKWKKQASALFEEAKKNANAQMLERRKRWLKDHSSHCAFRASQNLVPTPDGGICLSSSAKVARFLLDHPKAKDQDLEQFLRGDVDKRFDKLAVPKFFRPTGEGAFFATRERFVHIRYNLESEGRAVQNDVVLREFGLKKLKETFIMLGHGPKLQIEEGGPNLKETVSGVKQFIAVSRSEGSRSVAILSLTTRFGGHSIEVDLDDQSKVYSFWDPNFGRYTYRSIPAFSRGLAGLLHDIYGTKALKPRPAKLR